MPCEETASEIVVIVDGRERLTGYRYEKMTCGKEVGLGGPFLDFAKGKVVDELSEIDFPAVLKVCGAGSGEEEFLLYLEWRAVREALRAYLGKGAGPEPERYRLAEVIAGEEGVTIKMIVYPPDNMPEIVPCGEKRDSPPSA